MDWFIPPLSLQKSLTELVFVTICRAFLEKSKSAVGALVESPLNRP